jgi:hypothetical protein
MPLPVDVVEQALGRYLGLFRDCFSRPQWQHFVTVLLALMQCEEHRTLSAFLRAVTGAGRRVDGLARFLRDAPWSAEEVAARWWEHYAQTLGPLVAAEHARQRALRPTRRGRPRKTVVTGFLILDDSTHHKPKGRKMEGLGRHYSTGAGRAVRGHSLFTGLAVVLGRRCPLAPRLYRQRAVCQREGVPFRSKIDLAVEAIGTFEPAPDTRTHVLIDSWYTCRRVWRAAQGRGWAITAGLKANRRLRVPDPGRGPGYRSLAAYAADLTDADYQAVDWPRADGSARPVYAHLVPTFVRKLGPCQVLIVREALDQPLKEARYWATSERDADLATVVGWVARRWAIEQFIADVKEEFGTDHYQIRSARGIVRFWHLAFLGYLYLDEHRAALRADGADPGLTVGQARGHQRRRHRRLLLDWIHTRYAEGLTPDQVDQLLAA